jgi:hypothetical protein
VKLGAVDTDPVRSASDPVTGRVVDDSRNSSDDYGETRDGRAPGGDRPAIRKQLTSVIERHHAVTEKAPALLRVSD